LHWSIEDRPAYSVLKVGLDPGEEVVAEPGAMMLIRGDVSVVPKTGGLLKGLLRKALGGESIFLTHYRAGPGGGEVWFVPPLPGDIAAVELDGSRDWVVQDTSYLAHYGEVDVGVAWRGGRGLLAEGELFWLRLSGRGVAWVNAYGALERVVVGDGERMVVDNFHFVAMPADTRYRIRTIGGLKATLFSGEGLVVEVEGPAEVYVQTRILPELARLLRRFIRAR